MIFGFNTDVKAGAVVYHVQSEARHKELLLQTQVFVRGQCIGKCTNPFPEDAVLIDFAEDSVQEALKAQHRRIVDSVREGTLAELGITFPVSNPVSEAAAAAAVQVAAAYAPTTAANLSQLAAITDELEELDVSLLAKARPAASPVLPPEPEPKPESEHDEPQSSPQPKPLPLPRDREALVASSDGLTTGSLIIECTDARWLREQKAVLLVLKVTGESEEHFIEHSETATQGRFVENAALTVRFTCGENRPRYVYSSTDSSGMAEVTLPAEGDSGREAKVLVQVEIEGRSSTRRFHVHPPA
ncbi:MAG: hypothetical protein AB7O65_05630 [Candidatus Korobacteraceae bacterium]